MFNLIEAYDIEAAAYLIAAKSTDILIHVSARAKVSREWIKWNADNKAKAEAIEMALANA